jgi:hypothetical protein
MKAATTDALKLELDDYGAQLEQKFFKTRKRRKQSHQDPQHYTEQADRDYARSRWGRSHADRPHLHLLLTWRVVGGLSGRMTQRSRIMRTLVAVTRAEVAGKRRRSKTESHSEQRHRELPHVPTSLRSAFGP